MGPVWIIFISIVLFLLILDLGFFHKKDEKVSFKQGLKMSFFYVFVAFVFGILILYISGLESFAEYITGFIVEKSLALDNVFLISVIFSTFSIPPKYQHRVLFYGILGAIVLRAAMIGLGAHILSKFDWVLYIFGAFMIFTGVKMMFVSHKKVEISENLLLKLLKKYFNITDKLHDQKFYVYQMDTKSSVDTKDTAKSSAKKLFVTPLFVSLVMIEFTDLIFAVDSIPAIFAITQDSYIVYTSNIFATLGLRSLYFVLISIIDRFYYLKYSLALVLVFIGSKIFVVHGLKIMEISPMLSLLITLSILIWGMVYSYIKKLFKIS